MNGENASWNQIETPTCQVYNVTWSGHQLSRPFSNPARIFSEGSAPFSRQFFSAVRVSNANIQYTKLITKTCSTTWYSSRTCKLKTVQMTSHLSRRSYQLCKEWLAIWTVFGLHVLLLSHVVEHVFVINLAYGMLAFDARTAEKIAFESLKKGPSLPK